MSTSHAKYLILQQLQGNLAQLPQDDKSFEEFHNQFLNKFIQDHPEEVSNGLRSCILKNDRHQDFQAIYSRVFDTEQLKAFLFIGSLSLQQVKSTVPELYEAALAVIRGIGAMQYNIDIPPIRDETLREFKSIDEAASYLIAKRREWGAESTI
ncbi:hypothetical protein ACYZT8_27675 [Pseudomonas sp. LB3P93]